MLIYLLRSGLSGGEIALAAIEMFIAFTLTFAFHEFMHAAVAVWLGDDTPRRMGRLTLNPMVHVDPVGTMLILFIGFGWGRPVVVNPSFFNKFPKHRRLMEMMVAFAGPFGNFLMALLGSVVATVIACTAGAEFNSLVYVIYGIMTYLSMFSLGLMAFNLIPIAPLDGFKILREIVPMSFRLNNDLFRKFEAYGPRILLVLIILGRLGGLDVLGTIMGIISLPASLLISFIDSLIVMLLGGA